MSSSAPGWAYSTLVLLHALAAASTLLYPVPPTSAAKSAVPAPVGSLSSPELSASSWHTTSTALQLVLLSSLVCSPARSTPSTLLALLVLSVLPAVLYSVYPPISTIFPYSTRCFYCPCCHYLFTASSPSSLYSLYTSFSLYSAYSSSFCHYSSLGSALVTFTSFNWLLAHSWALWVELCRGAFCFFFFFSYFILPNMSPPRMTWTTVLGVEASVGGISGVSCVKFSVIFRFYCYCCGCCSWNLSSCALIKLCLAFLCVMMDSKSESCHGLDASRRQSQVTSRKSPVACDVTHSLALWRPKPATIVAHFEVHGKTHTRTHAVSLSHTHTHT